MAYRSDTEEFNKAILDAFDKLQETQRAYLEVMEALYITKFDLSLAVDIAYDNGEVQGKNEREREAYLRSLMPTRYKEIDVLERKARVAERAWRDAEVVTQRMKLQVALIVGSVALL